MTDDELQADHAGSERVAALAVLVFGGLLVGIVSWVLL